ncbi:MAG: hypothetical protein JSV00_04415 [bacterium]|nr:MAG: hypothetical protein JSV00_04415 [bacterium]
MSEQEKRLRSQLEEEARAWVKEEYNRRFNLARESLEKQGRETIEHLKAMGNVTPGELSAHAAHTQMCITVARSELLKEVEFEAENRVEEELKKRMKKTGGKGGKKK